MKIPENTTESLLAVFTQFWRTDKAYSLLLNIRTAGIVMIAVVIVISAVGYIPALLINWEEVETEWRSERQPELIEEGFTATRADSVISSELGEMKRMTESLPMARLVERGIIALLAALAAFGTVYAVENKKVGKVTDFLTSSMLSQSAYMLTGVLLILFVSLLDIPPSVRLNLSCFVPVDVVDPSRIHVFIYRFLESVDIPSIIAMFLWGRGLAAMLRRSRSWGIRLSFSMYTIGILLISLPVMFAPEA
ncbi:MAG: hypothetical protein K8S15_00960 [Candidatus Aegiribacteria sp.]|nr:hypothetical protein [Candidatus Aegiribacteria sp.]